MATKRYSSILSVLRGAAGINSERCYSAKKLVFAQTL